MSATDALAADLRALDHDLRCAEANATTREARLGASDPQTLAAAQRVEALRRVRDDLLGRAEA